MNDGRVFTVCVRASQIAVGSATRNAATTGSMNVGRMEWTALLLSNGKVLMVGGPAGQSELYDPFSGTWSATGTLNSTRFGFAQSLLSDGRVLVTDGSISYQIMSAEIYTP